VDGKRQISTHMKPAAMKPAARSDHTTIDLSDRGSARFLTAETPKSLL